MNLGLIVRQCTLQDTRKTARTLIRALGPDCGPNRVCAYQRHPGFSPISLVLCTAYPIVEETTVFRIPHIDQPGTCPSKPAPFLVCSPPAFAVFECLVPSDDPDQFPLAEQGGRRWRVSGTGAAAATLRRKPPLLAPPSHARPRHALFPSGSACAASG